MLACNNFVEAEVFLAPYFKLDNEPVDQKERMRKITFELKRVLGNCDSVIVWYESSNLFEMDLPVIKSNACLHEFHIMTLGEMFLLKIVTNKDYNEIYSRCDAAYSKLVGMTK
jgi:hypothetical protein